MLILSSNGLSSVDLIAETRQFVKGMEKAAMITIASIGYKEKDWHVPRLTAELKSLGLSVDYFDLDTQNPELLSSYDVIEIIGGNPFYLLKRMKETGCVLLFRKLEKDKVIIGISAGSVVLQKTIDLVAQYSPEMNEGIGLMDFSALALTDRDILPHYQRFFAQHGNLEEMAREYEKQRNCTITRLEDGQAVFIGNGLDYIMKETC
jgi:dipeptidase E